MIVMKSCFEADQQIDYKIIKWTCKDSSFEMKCNNKTVTQGQIIVRALGARAPDPRPKAAQIGPPRLDLHIKIFASKIEYAERLKIHWNVRAET